MATMVQCDRQYPVVAWTTLPRVRTVEHVPTQSVEAARDTRDAALPGFAVAAIREEGRWRCVRMDPEALVDLDAAITALRGLRSPGAVIGLLDVDDEFFVLLRPAPGGVRLLISDAVAALDYDVAADVLDLLRVELPPDDDALDDPWPEGDMGILSDFGMAADELEILVGDLELWPDEQLDTIARRLGFADPLDEAVGR
ncbi:putative tRNA adenosine deaminase-associated protein [Pseudonocardia endophytica]|uniref:Putative tRNA adenosine deaminase-associated protein n=1 Tax=Pseudonocardia endophytica TaxID=401976 RepID=A0A4R1I0Y0_PSEEN|nr:putative tRNA adenosine deaminase-associated protein [Pseudonocardia endophytica]